MAAGNLNVNEVVTECKKINESCNKPGHSMSSPVYGTRKTAGMAHEQTSNGGGLMESGFQMAPNSIKGPRRR